MATLRWQEPSGGGYTITEWDVEPRATALLLLDLQTCNVDPERGCGTELRSRFPRQANYYYDSLRNRGLAAAAELLAFFRAQGLPVVHAHSALALPDGRDIAGWSWRAHLSGRAASIPCLLPPGDPDARSWPDLEPKEGELTLLKQTLSPFNGTALDQYLRNMGVQNLVLAGVLTNGAVESTARNAGDRGFNAIVAADACAALSAEDQQAGTLFASWHIVRSTGEIVDELAPLLA
ncbi:MAG TPA: isochorismatase family cysteine hydrolase [Chloroflexota bacterium]|nr:isochorismatase family cysteine hydrolase [Chloroflexota bacterium]